MECSEFLARFSDFYDAPEGAPDRRNAEAHLAACESCQRYVEVVDRGVSMLRSVPEPSLASNFGARLEHRIFNVMEAESRGTGPNLPVMTAVGVAILLVAVAWVPRLLEGTPEVELSPLVVVDPPVEAAPFGTARPPFLPVDQPAGSSPLGRSARDPVGWSLFDDPTSLLYEYSPMRRNGLLRRTGIDH